MTGASRPVQVWPRSASRWSCWPCCWLDRPGITGGRELELSPRRLCAPATAAPDDRDAALPIVPTRSRTEKHWTPCANRWPNTLRWPPSSPTPASRSRSVPGSTSPGGRRASWCRSATCPAMLAGSERYTPAWHRRPRPVQPVRGRMRRHARPGHDAGPAVGAAGGLLQRRPAVRRAGAVRLLPAVDPEGADRPARAEERGYRFMLGVEPEFYVYRKDALPDLVPLAPVLRPVAHTRVRRAGVARLDRTSSAPWRATWTSPTSGCSASTTRAATASTKLDFAHADVLTTCDRLTYLRLLLRHAAETGAVSSRSCRSPPGGLGLRRAHEHEPGDSRTVRTCSSAPTPAATGPGSRWPGSSWPDCLAHAPALTALTCPDRQLVQAAGADADRRQRLVGAGVGGVRRTTTAPACCGCRTTDRRWRTAASTWPRTCTSPPRSRWRPGWRASSEELDPGEPVTEDASGWQDGLGAPAPQPVRGDRRVRGRPARRVKALPTDFVSSYVDMKRREWEDYHRVVTTWEVDRYLFNI